MVDMIAVPDRLEHAVGKAQHQDILDRFLAEVVIDPVNLLLVEQLQQRVVQLFGGSEVSAEWFFHHQPPPRAIFLEHAGAAKLLADRLEPIRRRRQIEQAIAAGLALGFELVERFAHPVE
jgi:hypothetical protein